jgi:ABC-type bacteriocin/lantibiotic exporter with double-glycine peptidase domain
MLRGGSLGALLASLFIAGCAITPNSDVNAFAQNSDVNSFEVFDRSLTSPEALVLPVVHDRQTRGPSCGAHALASIVNYWRGEGVLSGDALFHETPPTAPAGYSMSELLTLARGAGLTASAVRLPEAAIIRELENGRPVLVPVRLPSVYVQQRTLPGADVPVVDIARNTLIYRAARVSELTRLAMVDHYLVVVGYHENTFVVVEPVAGYRTIRASKLERFREAFDNAAIVFSAPTRARSARS